MRVVVIGGGIFGASVAYHLARAGADTVLVDAELEGRATAAGAGIINPWSGRRAGDPHRFALANASARYYPQLIQALAEDGEADTSYRRVGAMLVSADAAELDGAEPDVRALAAQAPEAGPVRRLSAQQARELFPPLRADLQAIHIAGGARVDGRKLAGALRRAAVRHGLQQRRGMAGLVVSGGRVGGVLVGGETIAADRVVVTAGAWAPELMPSVPVEPQRGQIIHLQLAGTDTSAWPVISPFADHYMLAFDDSRVVVGATRETGSGFDHRLTAGGVAHVLNNALGIAPGLGTATLLETRIGFRPMIASDRPILGPAPGVDGLFVGNGLGPSGLTLGPMAGKLLAHAVLSQATALDLAPYALSGC
jgi:D-amino-acid dehydrogenase